MNALLIQARSSSKRFPGKMLSPIVGGVPLVEFIYKRASLSKRANVIAVVTSTHETDAELFAYCANHGIKALRGSLANVLDRYIRAAEFFKADVICRVCGDSPFVDVELIDRMLEMQAREGLDYVAPDKSTCIAGLDSEVVTLSALRRSVKEATAEEAEHVTLFLKNNKEKFKTKFIDAEMRPAEMANLSLTIDYPKDLEYCGKIARFLGKGYDFQTKDIFGLLLRQDKNACS